MEEDVTPKFDPRLWFLYRGCKGEHFILGNPHTFPGRFWAWRPKKQRSFFLSKSEIVGASAETEYWLKGFLSGNEPSPPKGDDGMAVFGGPAYQLWCARVERFHEKGSWSEDEEPNPA